MSAVIEGLLWLAILISAYGQRDAWHAGNWSMFVVASCVGGVFALYLRSYYRATLLVSEVQP